MSTSASSSSVTKRKLNVALIGCGRQGRVHARNVSVGER